MIRATGLNFAALSARVQRWQLPTYDGTKSYQNLLVGVYKIEPGNTTTKPKYDTEIQIMPLDLIHSGNYDYNFGSAKTDKEYGYYWEQRTNSIMEARNLYFRSINFNPQSSRNKGYGLALRCLGC